VANLFFFPPGKWLKDVDPILVSKHNSQRSIGRGLGDRGAGRDSVPSSRLQRVDTMASHSTDAHAPGTDDHARDEPELGWNPLISNFPATDGVTEWEAANPYPSRPPRPERPFPKSAAGWKPDRILEKMRKAAACLRKNEAQKKLLETMLPVRNDGRSRSPPPRGARAGQVRNDSSSEEPPREEEEEEEDPPREEEDPPLEYLPHWSTSHSGQEEPPREDRGTASTGESEAKKRRL
jgi:hypothetical protein